MAIYLKKLEPSTRAVRLGFAFDQTSLKIPTDLGLKNSVYNNLYPSFIKE